MLSEITETEGDCEVTGSSDQLRELIALRRLVTLKRDNGLAFYKPHEKQDLFHAAGGYDRRYLRTGNRFGKSTCGAAEDLSFAIGARLWYTEGDPRRTAGIPNRSTKGLVIVADWDKAREQFTCQTEGASMGKLFKLMPKHLFEGVHKNQAGEIDCVFVKSIHGGISSIYLDTVKSYLSNPMGQESSDWDWIHVDEPCPQEMWIANARGLVDRDGKAWFTCTPIKHYWINQYFIPRSNMRDFFPDGKGDKDFKKWVLTGTMMDNPTLPSKAIDTFAEDLPEDEKAARIYGTPKSLSGLIYTEFDRSRHVYLDLPKGWRDFDCPPDDYTIRLAIDPHPKKPHAVLFAATAPTGQTYFYAEIFQQCLIDDLVAAIHVTLNGRTPMMLWCDLSAFNTNPTDGGSWADLFYAGGLPIVPASKELAHGIVRVQQELHKPDNLYFAANLRETLYEFDVYGWDPKSEKPIDRKDHMMENLYRLVLGGLDYVDDDPSNGRPISPRELKGYDLTLPKTR